eukprot:scaffold1786_cov181-Skeletonema_marinoi.AAC.5
MKGRDAHRMNCARGRRTNTRNAVASMADVLLSGGSVCTDGDVTLPVMDGHKHCCDSSVILSKNKEELNRVKKKLTSVKDRLEQAEVLLKEFNEADDCLLNT